MEKEIYTLKVYNTLTKQYEDVVVTKDVYDTYCHTEWIIKDNNASLYDHEIQMSGLIGGEDNGYENFREFVQEETPESIVIRSEVIREIQNVIAELNEADRKLISALFEEGISERKYARRTGVPRTTINNRKLAIMRKLKKFEIFKKIMWFKMR